MMTPLHSEPIPVTGITSDWYKFHFPRNSRVITRVNLTLGTHGGIKALTYGMWHVAWHETWCMAHGALE